MEQKSNAFLENEKLGKLMRMFAIPCIISLLVGALYNIVDQIFIANATYLGSYGNAANNVVFQDQILTMFGGRVNDETFRLAKEYFTWISYGIPFYMFGQAMNPVIRSDGSPRFAMVCTVIGAVFNIIFDPICIYVLKWGMMGAAVATVGGQVITALLSVWYLCHMKAIRLEKRSFGLSGGLMKKYLPLGFTSFLSQISLVASMAAVNNMVVKYSAMDEIFGQAQYAQIPMAVVGIVMKFFQIVISICVGMAAGCIPVVGYNVGAGRKDRVKDLFKMLLTAEFVLGLAGLVIVECFPRSLIGIFGAANESVYYTQFAVKAFRTYLCMMPLATVNKGTFIYMQSLGKAFRSSLLSFIREVVFGVGFALLLPLVFQLNGVLYSMPVSDFLTFVIAVVMILQIFRELKEE